MSEANVGIRPIGSRPTYFPGSKSQWTVGDLDYHFEMVSKDQYS